MEPNKFENQIREKLNLREIQPSAKTWDRLDAMLAVAEEKKTKRPFGFLFIAATITVLLAAGMFFFMQKRVEVKSNNSVVETDIKKNSVQKSNNNIQVPIKQENEIVVSSEPHNSQLATRNPKPVSINNQKTPSNQNPAINHDKTIEFQNSSDLALKDLPRIVDQKTVSAKNDDTKKLDEFLLAGLDNAAKQSASKKSTMKINAKTLLTQVDGELELTFREKIINRVSKDYKEVKVALANRNNE